MSTAREVSVFLYNVTRAGFSGSGTTLLRRHRENVESERRDEFQYEELPSTKSIRLLQIKPGNDKEVIECSLRTTDLDETSGYVALSYTWQKEEAWGAETWDKLYDKVQKVKAKTKTKLGHAQKRWNWKPPGSTSDDGDHPQLHENDKSSEKTIICNGRSKRIPPSCPSLYGALLQLRQSFAGHEFWIDAICIDQANTNERNSQVGMMGRIYNNAQMVVVWLGPVPVSPMRLSPLQMSSILDKLASTSTLPDDTFDSLAASEFCEPIFLEHLLNRRYYSRVWVLQEIAMAQEVVLLFGDYRFDPESLWKPVSVIADHMAPTTKIYGRKVSGMGRRNSRSILQINSLPFRRAAGNVNSLKATQSTLQEWLSTCVGREVTDERDLVFAGLSLIRSELLRINWKPLLADSTSETVSSPFQPRDTELNENRPALPPRSLQLWDELHTDYGVTPDEVLLNLAASVLSGPEPMNLLSISSQMRFPNGWQPNVTPSWIPTLKAPSKSLEKLLDVRTYFDGLKGNFSAAIHLQNSPEISLEKWTLTVDGCRLGKIRQIFFPLGEEEPMLPDGDAKMDNVLSIIRELHTSAHNYNGTNASTLAAFVSASTCGYFRHDHSRVQAVLAAFCSCIDRNIYRYLGEQEQELNILRSLTKSPKKKSKTSESQKQQPEAQIKECQEKLDRWRREIYPLYTGLKDAYPDAPWQATDTSPAQQEDLNVAFLPIKRAHFYNSLRRVFFTHSGYIGLAATVIREGDEVMLIKGAPVPYIFRRVDDVLLQTIKDKEQDLQKAQNDSQCEKAEEISRDIQDLQGKIGRRDGWVLVGEAYIEGIMDGEAVAQYADCFERITIF